LVLAKSARDSVGDLANQITGREVSGDMSKKQNYENSLYSGEFDKTSERLDKLEKATGISQQDSIEKIKEIKENNHSTIKDLLEQLKRDPARRKEIYDEIVSQTKADLKAMNDILQEDTRKLEKKQLKSLEELQEAKDDDDKKQISILNAETKKQEIALRQLRDINKDLDKKMKEQKSERETVNKLVESQNKT
jgi:hypothetical protein